MLFSPRTIENEVPRLVCVETTNRCNAKCVFCPNNALARDKGAMSQDLFEKIIEDCREFPLEAIEPFMQGDPFSDPDIMPRLQHIRRRLPNTKLRLYTNGYGMTPKRIDEMLDLGIDHLYVSVNTLDHDKYQEVMGIKLERTLRNLEYLTSAGRQERVARRITFRMTRLQNTTLEDQDRFIEYCKDKGVRPFIVGLFNYKGDIDSDLSVPKHACEHVYRLDILASGKVTLCCMDQDGDYSWGDVNHHSVLDVYRGKIARKYRDMHRTGRRNEISPCNNCTNFWPGFRDQTVVQKVRTAVQAGMYFAKHRPYGRRAPPEQAAPPPSVSPPPSSPGLYQVDPPRAAR